MGIDYCEYERGMCPALNVYRNVLTVLLIPLILLSALFVYVLAELLGLPLPSYLLLALVCIVYFSILGFVAQRLFRL